LSSIFGSATARARATSIRHADRDVPTGVVFLRACAPKRDPRRWVAYTPIPASVLSL
jgi:hypothetical protein